MIVDGRGVSATDAIQTAATPLAPVRADAVLQPLAAAYALSGLAPPGARVVASHEIPAAYRRLLDHGESMTLALERFTNDRLVVRLLSMAQEGDRYLRRVLLSRRSGAPVEMGAVQLNLACFSHGVRAQILEARLPLGRILMAYRAGYRSRATALLEITPNSEMMGVFWMAEPALVYGRQAELLYDDSPIGQVLEVLTPIQDR